VTPAPAAGKSEPDLLDDAAKFAASGHAKECVEMLDTLSRQKGPGDYAEAPLSILLEGVKGDLKNATVPSSKVVTALATCELVLRAIPECLPRDDPRASELSAKAQNRRGDALLLLGRAKESLEACNAAIALTPDDAYIRYNRGRANLALGDAEAARSDFKAASAPAIKQPGARKLAAQALAELK
jgi:tetratricopeptide (TPR) repeat protein